MDKRVTYYVQAKTFRQEPGWRIGSRGGEGFPISIFVPGRDAIAHQRALAIRDAYRNAEVGIIGRETCDLIVDEVLIGALR